MHHVHILSTSILLIIFPLSYIDPPAVRFILSLYTLMPSLITQNDGGEDDCSVTAMTKTVRIYTTLP